MKAHRSDGFVSSVGNKELSQKYGNVSAHPMSPGAAVPAQPAAPTKPLGSTDCVTAADMPIVTGFNTQLQQLEGAQLTSAERRQVVEMQKAKSILFSKLNDGVLSASVVAQLHEIVACFGRRDFAAAQKIHVKMTGTEWAEHKDWLRGVKAIITTALKRLN